MKKAFSPVLSLWLMLAFCMNCLQGAAQNSFSHALDKFNIIQQLTEISAAATGNKIDFKGPSYGNDRSSYVHGGNGGIAYFKFPDAPPPEPALNNDPTKNIPLNNDPTRGVPVNNQPGGPNADEYAGWYYNSYQPAFSRAADTTHRKKGYFGFGAGLYIAAKGGKDKYDFGDNEKGTDVYHITYLEIPLLVRYQYALSNGGSLYAMAGPYYAYVLGGKASYAGETGKQKLKFGSSNADFRRGDFGLQLGVGYRLPGLPWRIGISGDLGLRNLFPGGGDDKNKTRSIGLSVGYIL